MSVDYSGVTCAHCGSANVQIHVSACCRVMLCRDCGYLEELRSPAETGVAPRIEWLRDSLKRGRRTL